MNPDILLMCILTIFDTYPDYRSTTLGSYDRLLALILVLDVPQQCIDVSYNSLLALLEALENPPLNILNIRSLTMIPTYIMGKMYFLIWAKDVACFTTLPEKHQTLLLKLRWYSIITRDLKLEHDKQHFLVVQIKFLWLMWLKSYPTYNILAIVFDVPIEFVCSTV